MALDGASQLFKSLFFKKYDIAKQLVENQVVQRCRAIGERRTSLRSFSSEKNNVNCATECQLYMDSCKSLFEENDIANFKCGQVCFPALKCESLLYFAVMLNKPSHVKFLLDGGANPDDTFNGSSVLTKAIKLNQLEIVKILVSFKANVRSSLACAAENRRYEIATWLLGLGKSKFYQFSALNIAIKLGDLRMVKILCSHGIRDAYRISVIPAIQQCQYALIRFLLKSGVDPNYPNKKPLEFAIKKRDKIAVKLLIEYKADVNMPFCPEGSSLHTAISSKDDGSIIKILLEANADPKLRAIPTGYTAFLRVCHECDLKMIKLFMKYGIFDPKGLYHAAYNKDPKPLMYLLTNVIDHDVNARIEEKFGYSRRGSSTRLQQPSESFGTWG